MLDIHELKIFLIAAETENFSAAARQLNLTQPAVSMQMRSLERKLDLSLFHRAGRTLSLTEQGKMLVPMARDIVQRSIHIEEELEALKGEVVGSLRLGCSTTTGKYFLPSLVARFRQKYPKVQVMIKNISRADVLSQLSEGYIHLGVVSSRPAMNDMECRHFFDDHMILVVPTAHPWASRESITLNELRGSDFILRTVQSGTREEMETALTKAGLTVNDLNVVMEMGNSEAISMAVEEGIGVAFVSRTVARRGIEIGKLKELKVTGLGLQREVFITASTRHPATRAQAEFWSFVQQPDNEKMLELAA